MEKFKNLAIALRDEEEGQGLAEYGLILVLVSIAAIGMLTYLGGQVGTAFTTTGDALQAP